MIYYLYLKSFLAVIICCSVFSLGFSSQSTVQNITDNSEKKIERYRNNDINIDEEWNEYNPWLNRNKPRLPLFRKSLSETIEESQIL